MESLLHKQVVLELNAFWMPLSWKTPAQAITSLCTESGEKPHGFVIDPIVDEETGKMVDYQRYSWDEWMTLPVKPQHLALLTKRGAIRCPTVILASLCREMPVKALGFSPDAIRIRDGDTCQVSGRKLAPGEGNMGHLQARAFGGKKTFDNIVYMDKELNRIQGTKTVEEMGWTLIKEPTAPKPMPASFRITEPKTQEHKHFILR